MQGLPNFLATPIISGTGKATDFKFCTHIHGADRSNRPRETVQKVAIHSQGLLKVNTAIPPTPCTVPGDIISIRPMYLCARALTYLLFYTE